MPASLARDGVPNNDHFTVVYQVANLVTALSMSQLIKRKRPPRLDAVTAVFFCALEGEFRPNFWQHLAHIACRAWAEAFELLRLRN